jgi:hypothetical protein
LRARQSAAWFDSTHPDVALKIARALTEGGV